MTILLSIWVVVAISSFILIYSQRDSETILSPPLMALILVLNLLPAIGLLLLYGRHIALEQARKKSIGSNGRLHLRLISLFSLVVSIPMLLVVIFASLFFQYGVEFWFSDRSRNMLENANDLAHGYYEQSRTEVAEEATTMAIDLRDYLNQTSVEDPNFAEGYVFQIWSRKLNESAIIEFGRDETARTVAVVDPSDDYDSSKIEKSIFARLKNGEQSIIFSQPDKIAVYTMLDPAANLFLYAARDADMLALSQWERAQQVVADYNQLYNQSRSFQLQFHIALFFITLIVVGVALWVALIVADRLVQPIAELVHAAKRITEGDLRVRVSDPDEDDDIGKLGTAFNRMTEKLDQQTSALLAANEQLGNRRAFMETVLNSVSAGIISVDERRLIILANGRAQQILKWGDAPFHNRRLQDLSPQLDDLLKQGIYHSTIQIVDEPEILTLEVRVSAKGSQGNVIMVEDITRQLHDQRQAAWSDVARRIAHEIKNPLTPIQLAAERLRRRYGKRADEQSGDGLFSQLVDTIIRQVGDLRNIVDEFGSFARSPEPVYREDNLTDTLRQTIFLHDVAHSDIKFSFTYPDEDICIKADRRQLAQAFTNILKNAVEAIELRMDGSPQGEGKDGHINVSIEGPSEERGEWVTIRFSDNGIGLPHDINAILEPYVTNRPQGTGLGLAIVNRIIQEHAGSIEFTPNKPHGATVTICINVERLKSDSVRVHKKWKIFAQQDRL